MNKNARYILNLDLFRALAIILVLYSHLLQQIFPSRIIDTATFDIGKHGITLFFVLSGFLVGGIYYRNPSANPFIFWFKRFLRTYPPYIIILLISWSVVMWTRSENFDWGYVFMIQNYYKKMPYFLISWSLCVQEHFYLFFTLLIIFIKRNKHHVWIWGSLCILPIFFRLFLGGLLKDGFGYYATATHFQIDSIAFGVFSSCLVHTRSFSIRSNFLSTIILLLSFFFISCLLHDKTSFATYVLRPTFLNILATLLLLSLYFNEPLKISNSGFIKWNSKIAYSIYLVHSLVIHVVIYIFSLLDINQKFMLLCSTVIGIYIVAYIFYTLIEKPVIQFRNLLLKD